MGRQRTAYIGLGSNLGDRLKALETAVMELGAMDRTRVRAVSPVYETSPVEAEGGLFLNAVAVIETHLEPEQLLENLQRLERSLGRAPESGGTGARIIDLDLLLLGNTVLAGAGLILPHPRMLHRRFVMQPLADLEPDLVVPHTGLSASEAAVRLAQKYPDQKLKRLGTWEELMNPVEN